MTQSLQSSGIDRGQSASGAKFSPMNSDRLSAAGPETGMVLPPQSLQLGGQGGPMAYQGDLGFTHEFPDDIVWDWGDLNLGLDQPFGDEVRYSG